jgi:hypothetical protein
VAEASQKVNWGVERRLEFIEFRLFWEGRIGRSDIMGNFGVSEPQASKDLTLYQLRAPGNAVYDKVARTYVPGANFDPIFMRNGPSDYLVRLRSLGEGLFEPSETWLGRPPEVDVVLNPAREMDTECLRAILRAVRETQSIEVHYQSMSTDEPSWRRITPHALGYDGFRWHTRAFCHSTERFRDFLIPRVTGTRNLNAPGRAGTEDTMWTERFGVVIQPHPDLGPNQQAMVAKDYGMENGRKVLDVRYAMLFYTLKRLGLIDRPREKPARQQHIVVFNADETEQALKQADWSA